MIVEKTNIKDCFLIKPKVFKDERGYFFESFHQEKFEKQTHIKTNFIQDNESMSNYGVIRGLHAQQGKFAQAKLIRVVQGKVLDVIVDARKDSPSFGEVYSSLISAYNKYQIFVPKGCLHGFSVLQDETIFTYKCDEFYLPSSEIGVYPLDEDLAIDWGLAKGEAKLSDKDVKNPKWKTFVSGIF
ncbi:dTDP-4-dehydrorhamnose 3,5-epimerase [Psychroflexus salis]|uniref:dTDP-4-dehydrorhamnose 3,5-epimerase n=1 Tax=Psychroflexus salis TaxID=1526574 RepID=A0A916ZNP2_9FLAO|nr:dTDP-4-dehydrorhamnose 3,5-epimerase [Psychroflexus salis]GGE06485.1 dTDP-4-dehydrorhamnose 3,5-epimerase [Psychroflexus salis]